MTSTTTATPTPSLVKTSLERPGDLMKNLETPGKTGRVGRFARYDWNQLTVTSERPTDLSLWSIRLVNCIERFREIQENSSRKTNGSLRTADVFPVVPL